MRPLAILSRLFLLLPAFSSFGAEIVDVENGDGGRIELQAASCELVLAQGKALQAWSARLGEAPRALPATTPGEYGRCRLSVGEILPSSLRQTYNRFPGKNGPNCWNTSLRATGLVRGIRLVAEDEMTFWMHSPYCAPVASLEDLRPGDIHAYRRKESERGRPFEEVHGAIFLTESLVYHKLTSTSDTEPTLFRAPLTLQTYRIYDDTCLAGSRNGKCARWVDNFRCRSPRAELDRLRGSDAALDGLAKRLEALEDELSAYTLRDPAPGEDDQFKVNEKKVVEALQGDIRALAAQSGSSQAFFLESFRQATESMLGQLRMEVKPKRR
jgi:hypothetical protein